MSTKLSIDELTRRAFIWAEQDRSALAEAWDKSDPNHAEARDQAKQLRDYRIKRLGKTKGETLIESGTTAKILDLKEKHQP